MMENKFLKRPSSINNNLSQLDMNSSSGFGRTSKLAAVRPKSRALEIPSNEEISVFNFSQSEA